jgi:hypothetical protein
VIKILVTAATALSVAVLAAAPASAYTDTFVGKGEVQELLGVNNATMQLLHTSVTFEYDVTTEVSFACEWWTGPERNRTYHTNTKTETVAVNALVASTSRKTGQWTGWTLTDGLPTAGGAVEVTDADCGAEGNAMKSLVEGSVVTGATTGGLYAVVEGQRYLLTPDPVAVS